MPQILVIDDNQDILEALDLLLSLHGYHVLTADNKKDALMKVAHQTIDLVIQDMNFANGVTSGEEGKSLFFEMKAMQPDLAIILITAWSQLETAIELVKAGATDYLQKPWDDTKLLMLIEEHCSEIGSESQTKPKPKQAPLSALIYDSVEMQSLMESAKKVASADVNVLVSGANGSGKEKLADFLHQNSSRVADPFIKVNMGALPQELMEAELFGAEKGAFTGANQARAGRFEAAHNGTLFLDEIGNLSLTGQMKLLRVLQTGEFERLGSNKTIKVDVRVISATNIHLPTAVKQGDFREDLYYRLNVIELHVPALKNRKADIIPLATYFIGSENSLSLDAKNYLLSHHWPGNVRELENACKRALVFASNNIIQEADFNSSIQKNDVNEQDQIINAIIENKGVIKHAALALGLSRQALYRRIEKFNIDIKSLC